MTETKLKTIVREAVELDREIQRMAERLKELKSLLVKEACGREEDHEEADGGGTRWVAEGDNECIARVNFPAPTLKSKIDADSKDYAKLSERLGRLKEKLLQPVLAYRPVADFREQIQLHFSKPDARAIITLAETKSAPRVSFETKEKAAA